MRIKQKLMKLVGKLKQHGEYECADCDFEAARKHFDESGDDIVCPSCGSSSVHLDT